MRAALNIAFCSAWQLQTYLAPVAREWRSSMSSRTPRGSPLKPVERTSLSGPTITAPTCRPFSVLQVAKWCANSINRSSHFLARKCLPFKNQIRSMQQLFLFMLRATLAEKANLAICRINLPGRKYRHCFWRASALERQKPRVGACPTLHWSTLKLISLRCAHRLHAGRSLLPNFDRPDNDLPWRGQRPRSVANCAAIA
jgi:hypothetical protein